MATTETTVSQFRAFVADTNHRTAAEDRGGVIYGPGAVQPKRVRNVNWRAPVFGLMLDEAMPVVHVDHNDAAAFCKWLSGREGRTYRLPTTAGRDKAVSAGWRPEVLPVVYDGRAASAGRS